MTDKPQFVGEKVASITIGELGKTQSGGTPSSKHPEYFDGEIPWIGTTALKGGFLDKTDAIKLITEEAVAKSATKIVPARSVMVGIRVGVGKVGINSVPMCTSQDVVSIVGIDERFWDKEYIALALKHKAPMLVAQAQGATITGITSKTLKAITIPIRSKDEQSRIVCQLNEIGRQLTNAERQIAKLDQLTKSRFVEMFGDPVRGKSKFSKSKLGELAAISSGATPKRDHPEYYGGNIPWVKTTEVARGNVTAAEEYITQAGLANSSCRLVPAGSVLVAMYGQGETRGKAAMLEIEAATNQACAAIECDPAKLDASYALHHLHLCYEDLRSKSKGGNQKNLSLAVLKQYGLICPPLSFQQEFADFAAQVDKSRFIAQQQIEKLQMLYDSLAQEYFGE
jgi:type I restriction enzyme, S subunit